MLPASLLGPLELLNKLEIQNELSDRILLAISSALSLRSSGSILHLGLKRIAKNDHWLYFDLMLSSGDGLAGLSLASSSDEEEEPLVTVSLVCVVDIDVDGTASPFSRSGGLPVLVLSSSLEPSASLEIVFCDGGDSILRISRRPRTSSRRLAILSALSILLLASPPPLPFSVSAARCSSSGSSSLQHPQQASLHLVNKYTPKMK